VASGPLVRSSYHAAEGFVEARLRPAYTHADATTGPEFAAQTPVFSLPESDAAAHQLIQVESLVRR
jgi:hypothetical protein